MDILIISLIGHAHWELLELGNHIDTKMTCLNFYTVDRFLDSLPHRGVIVQSQLSKNIVNPPPESENTLFETANEHIANSCPVQTNRTVALKLRRLM